MILRAYLKKSISINFLERRLISTGIYIQFSETRNNFFIKKLIDTKTICLIHFMDKEKKKFKEIKVLIINISFKPFLIIPYEKIGIMNITKNTEIKWESSDILNQSRRGSDSFGSTGI
ncbi:dCTP deaminase/dUTPase family protein [Blattabacterium cuenoti]|uniref:deoxyuridine 5'-triphosphate nucleotidohydrolase n=1 Tax=Blattabacterium cuenoti TaxID=1653831 RepID=UPI001EEA496D|nr:deoxyuridine 5'-triphosphate nucleotidohydrolase [Blattabacterium cuenoti]